jgi:DNA-binding transcriptional LysR family regulator
MELNQLLSFHQIIKTGSFTKASQKMLRTQSALSHQMKNLEKELNVKLFDRSGNMIKLTWEGEILLQVISKFLDDIENLKSIYQDAREGKRGTLVIATSSAIMTYCITDVIQKFKRQLPNIKFKLISSTNIFEIQAMLLEGLAQLGIGAGSVTPSPKLNFLYWRSFDKILLSEKGHPLSKKKSIHLSDVARYPLILYREGTTLRRDVEEAFQHNNLPYEVILELDVSENIKKYVELGLGISILSSLTITEEDKTKFYLINVNHLFKNIDYGIYYRKDKLITTPMREFIKIFAPELLPKILKDSAPIPKALKDSVELS